MARNPRFRRARLRRLVTLGTLVFVAVGLIALEHTATGASTGKPSQVYLSGHYGGHETTTTKPVTTTTKRVTTTTAKHGSGGDGQQGQGDPGNRHCGDQHGRDRRHEDHCRDPSGDR